MDRKHNGKARRRQNKVEDMEHDGGGKHSRDLSCAMKDCSSSEAVVLAKLGSNGHDEQENSYANSPKQNRSLQREGVSSIDAGSEIAGWSPTED